MKCLKPFIATGRVAYPCGQCIPCRINRRRIWTHRIMLEAAQHGESSFVTLTYRDESIPAGGNVEVGHIQAWLKRLRRRVEPRAIRYFAVGEYGDQSWRPHYHVALFGHGACQFRGIGAVGECPCMNCSVVRETWGFGHTLVGTLEERSAQYIAGYTVKKMTVVSDQRLMGRKPEFARMSLRPGIGAHAMSDVASVMMQYRLEESGDVPGGLRHGSKILPLGRYLRRRLRREVGLDEKCPEECLEAIRSGLLPVFEYAEALGARNDRYRFGEKSFPQLAFEEINRQYAANVVARDNIRKRRVL